MLGRVLFALVCLIIATGLLLPIYPAEVEVATPGVADAQDMLVADAGAAACRNCPTVAARLVGRCLTRAPSAAAGPTRACVHLTVYLVVRPLPVPGRPGEPQLLPPKLPTI
jgi:hypothetical protein